MKPSKLLKAILLFLFTSTSIPAGPLAILRHLTRVKIIESNNVTTRPGSIYDNITYFESWFGFPNPKFKYEFIDTGLGVAEPLYPMHQNGAIWFDCVPH